MGCRACKVYPVDGPALFGAVGVRFVGWQNKVLVLAYLVALAIHLVPAVALNTVYQHILGNGLFAGALVVFGLGIVADIGNIQTLAELIVLFHLDQHRWQHHHLFALETVFLLNHRRKNTQKPRVTQVILQKSP